MTKVGQKLYEDWYRDTISYGNEQRQDESARIAKNMLDRNTDEAFVMQVTGLTQEQIDKILGREPVMA